MHELLFERIRQAFPAVNLDQAIVNTDGMMNIAIIAEGRVFRFAKEGDYAREALHIETAILRLVKPYITLPIPDFQVLAEDFVSYAFLSGEPLFRNDLLRLPATQQVAVLGQLGAFLQQLHSIPLAVLHAHHIPNSGGRQTQAEWLQLYEDIQQELYPLMYRATRTWVDQHFAPLVQDARWLDFTPCLIHDDLAQYHILYDAAQRRISGVLDFGVAGLGDPARDYGILINVYGESLVTAMRPDLDAPTLDRARFYAGTAELQWLLGGIRSGDQGILTAHIDRARDVRPYSPR
jgi:aminoglycoside 2''-phosphotransferase